LQYKGAKMTCLSYDSNCEIGNWLCYRCRNELLTSNKKESKMTKWNITKQELVDKAQELHDDIVIFLSENNNLRLGQISNLKDIKSYLAYMEHVFTEEELKNG
jgi:hypothetical protein